MIEFRVDGEPVPQGSKTVGHSKGGGTFVREDNPKTEPWRNAVAARAREAMDGRKPMAGPLQLNVVFYFGRPKGHYRTGRHAGELKPTAPDFCSKRPDLDKLLRALGDALTGVAFVDDAAISIVRARKRYGSPGAVVQLDVIEDDPYLEVR